MSDAVKRAPEAGEPMAPDARAPTWRERWRRIKGPAIFSAAALAVIWVGLPRVPPAWGVHFGTPYLTFFSLAALGASAFFVLLNWGPIRQPGTVLGTFASIVFVYVATVGGMVAFGYWYYPQFEKPAAAATAASAVEGAAEKRGREIFLKPAFNCFACHTIEALGIRGGQRGPDLSEAGKLADIRKPGMSAEDYLRESIIDPWACLTPLPSSGLAECQAAADPAKTFPQLMPPGFKDRLSASELSDLIAFLRSLRGTTKHDGKHG